MAFTASTASVVMTERIEGILRSGLVSAAQDEAVTFNLFMQDATRERTNELGRRIPFTVTPNASYGSIAEGAQFPLPGTPAIVQGRIYYLNQTLTGEINGAVLDQETESGLMQFMRTPMDMDFGTFKNRNNLWMHGTGDGALGVVTAITTGASGTATLGGDYGAENVIVGSRLVFYSTGGSQHSQSGAVPVSTVTAVNYATNVVTFDAVPTDAIVTDTLHYEASYGRAPHGIPYHNSETSGTWLGLNTGTYSGLKATVFDAGATSGSGGTALTPGMIDLVQARSRKRGGTRGNVKSRIMISHPTQLFNYTQLGYTSGYGIQRVIGMNGKLDLGISAASHNGMAWHEDPQAARSRIDILNLKDWAIEYTRLPSFYDFHGDKGQKLIQKSGSGSPFDALQYVVIARYDLVCKDRKNQAAITNLPYISGL
jgi:hypothetical protein